MRTDPFGTITMGEAHFDVPTQVIALHFSILSSSSLTLSRIANGMGHDLQKREQRLLCVLF